MAAPTESLVGEVAFNADSNATFNQGNTDGDIKIEGSAAVGLKVSNATREMYDTSLTSTYDFSVGGTNEGEHIVVWMNSLTPAAADQGMRIICGNGTDRGEWYLGPPAGYTGGFIPLVVDPATDFDNIQAGSWSLTGNPGQLTAVSELGGTIQTITSIMGNFNNGLIDQGTVGLGLRVEDGDVTTPGTFEGLRDFDEGTNVYGWMTSNSGNFLSRGKIFIGPASGNNSCRFEDSDQVVIFVAAPVATGFYEIEAQEPGSGTTEVILSGMVVRAEDPAVARWSLTVSDGDWTDSDSLYDGFDALSLNSRTALTGVKLNNGNSVLQNGATLDGCQAINANTGDGVALIQCDDPSKVSNCDFVFSDGHALEITQAGTYDFDGNSFSGFGADGTNDAAILVDGVAVTLNIGAGGGTPTKREVNGGTLTVNNFTDFTLTGLVAGSEVRIIRNSDDVELAGVESSGASFTYSYNYVSDTAVRVIVHHVSYEWVEFDVTLTNQDASIPINQRSDRNYLNP